MESTVTANAMSLSLLARNVYGVCFTMRDSRELLRGELAQAREKAADLTGEPPIFLHQDMPHLDLYGTVEGAMCCLDSLNYLTDPKGCTADIPAPPAVYPARGRTGV